MKFHDDRELPLKVTVMRSSKRDGVGQTCPTRVCTCVLRCRFKRLHLLERRSNESQEPALGDKHRPCIRTRQRRERKNTLAVPGRAEPALASKVPQNSGGRESLVVYTDRTVPVREPVAAPTDTGGNKQRAREKPSLHISLALLAVARPLQKKGRTGADRK